MAAKTFRASTMLEALEKVQQELGPDALVISARNVPGGSAWQVWRQPEVEIVATLPEGNTQPRPTAQSEATAEEKSTPASASGKGPKEQRWQPQRLTRAQAYGQTALPVETQPAAVPTPPEKSAEPPQPLRAIIETARAAAPVSGLPSNLRPLQQMLLAQELEPAWVDRQMALAAGTLPAGLAIDGDTCRNFLRRQMEAELKSAPPDRMLPLQRVIVLVGANGSGKTSLVARLARHYAITQQASVQWVCADTTRASAIAEARTYTRALEIPLHLVYTPEDWTEILNNTADLTLVDTQGINPWDERQMIELGELLPPTPSRLIYLAVSANTKLKDALQ